MNTMLTILDLSLHSPGYMLTKLTKTILAHDTELKVRFPLPP